MIDSPVCDLHSFYVNALSLRVDTTISAIHSLNFLRDPQIQLLLLRSCLGSRRLIYLLRSIPPLPDILPPLHAFDNALKDLLREAILGHAQFFRSLQVLLSSLPLSKGELGISRAVDFFSFAFLSSSLDTLPLQTGLLESASLSPVDLAIDRELAPPDIRSAYAQLAACDGTSVTPLHRSSPSTGHTYDGTRPFGHDRASTACDEDTATATPSTQSLLVEHFFAAAATRACDLLEPARSSGYFSLLLCLQMRGSS